jgi:hypothetical protein
MDNVQKHNICTKLHGAEPYFRIGQLCSYSRIFQHFMNLKVHYSVHKSHPLIPNLMKLHSIE